MNRGTIFRVNLTLLTRNTKDYQRILALKLYPLTA
jgi:predicted nucleic acid-binding protein